MNVRPNASSGTSPVIRFSRSTKVGLKGVKNGELLRAAVEQGFDVLITVDRKLPSQQNLAPLSLAFVILVARPCRYAELKLLVPEALKALNAIKAGDLITIQ